MICAILATGETALACGALAYFDVWWQMAYFGDGTAHAATMIGVVVLGVALAGCRHRGAGDGLDLLAVVEPNDPFLCCFRMAPPNWV